MPLLEMFLQRPYDLYLQSSTWSEYKQHNTGKFLVACTPNGAVWYVSPLYVGSISDVELTRVSGFLTKLEDKPGISIMADRGFTIKDILRYQTQFTTFYERKATAHGSRSSRRSHDCTFANSRGKGYWKN